MSWTCRRQSKGVKCGWVNPNRKRKCEVCHKTRPPRKRPEHMKALEMTYEECVAKWGERCGVCGAKPKPGKRLHRDHEHKGDGAVRGLACFRCNSGLRNYMTLEWLENAVAYLKRFEEDRMPKEDIPF